LLERTHLLLEGSIVDSKTRVKGGLVLVLGGGGLVGEAVLVVRGVVGRADGG
jgi:hypothetical protein